MIDFAHACVEYLGAVSFQAVVFTLVVLGVTRLASKAPASVRSLLWVLVLIKLLIPPFAEFPSELVPWQKHNTPVVHRHVQDLKQAASPGAVSVADQTAVSPKAGREVARQVQMPSILANGAFEDSDSSIHRLSSAYTGYLRQGLMLAWISGAMVMLLMLAIRFVRQVQIVRGSSEVEPEMIEILRSAADSLGVKRLPQVRLTSYASAPMLVGITRPTILLPLDITDVCGESDLKAMLLHELAHVKRRDMVVIWLQEIVSILFFFHPALWLASSQLRKERELACDELVISRSGIRAKDYAAGYVSALKLASFGRRSAISLAMAEPFDMEKRRLNMILRENMPKLSYKWWIAVALILAAGIPTFAGLSRLATMSEIAKTLNHQKSACGPSLSSTIETSSYENGRLKVKSHSRLVRAPEVLWSKTDDSSGFATTSSNDMSTSETRVLIDRPKSDPDYRRQGTIIEGQKPGKSPQGIMKFPGSGFYSIYSGGLGDFIASGQVSKEMEKIDGCRCQRVTIPPISKTDEAKHYLVWVDPKIGFNPRRIKAEWAHESSKVINFSDYKKVCNGVWFPGQIVEDWTDATKKTYHVVTKVSGISAGRRYKKEDLIVRFAPGLRTTVYKDQAQRRYSMMFLSNGRTFIWRGRIESPLPYEPTVKMNTYPKRQMLPEVSGAGVRVTLHEGTNPAVKSRAVGRVYDVDLHNTVNSLFASGARAVSINGQRVTRGITAVIKGRWSLAGTAIRPGREGKIQVGEKLLPPPYVIDAVGDPDALIKGLSGHLNPAQTLKSLGMLQVQKKSTVVVPAGKA